MHPLALVVIFTSYLSVTTQRKPAPPLSYEYIEQPFLGSWSSHVGPPSNHSEICPQARSLHPSKNETYEALGGAVRIPTESYDTMGPVGKDPQYEIFGQFHEYLERAYPLVHSTLRLTKVNTYGLLYHWQGTSESLKPILLAGHQDIVPIDPTTIDQWIHPPYSGYFDGRWIWGRGSCDDKASVIAILASIESLLLTGFKPIRTIVVAFGFDEESAGTEGAGHLAVHLESIYRNHGFAALLDEGSGFSSSALGEGIIFATPCTSEKGSMDIKIEVATTGGHSSVPPAHTGIGILSAAIVELESNPHPPALYRNGTPFATYQCIAAHAPNISTQFRELAKQATGDDEALRKFQTSLLDMDPLNYAIMGTTQAVDIIEGGIKTNALPERASAIVNHRIAEHSSIEELQQRIASILLPVAEKFNLTFTSFGMDISAGSGQGGHLALSEAYGVSLTSSPVTPSGIDDIPYQILSGTIKAVLKNTKAYEHKKVIVSPLLSLGNTDTASYWNLTEHIFRYQHFDEDVDMFNGLHTVNEAIRGEAVIDAVKFYTMFILNWDESSA
ncbi:peptidase M20A family protein [Abortiporus biennis]